MKNKAAQALGSIKSPAKTAAARENGKLGGRPPHSTIAMLFKGEADEDGNTWWLATYKGATIPTRGFPTAAAARSYAAARKMGVKRCPDCDA